MCGWLPMLVSNNKLIPHRQYMAWYLALSTNGVYHQHDMCGVPAHRLKMRIERHYGHYIEPY